MKNIFLLLAVIALTGTVWFKFNPSGDTTIAVDASSSSLLNTKAGERVPAQLNTPSGDWQELPCKATGQAGYVTCQFPQEYAGQQVAIELTWDDVMNVMLVNVPAK
ncbi:MAG: hypothetical protein QM730_09985 [Anaerolineales bacterium]